LWVMVTAVATVYQIASGRNRAALKTLVGTDYRRVLTSDRHSIYSHLAEGRHQRSFVSNSVPSWRVGQCAAALRRRGRAANCCVGRCRWFCSHSSIVSSRPITRRNVPCVTGCCGGK
jgi:hypothetical protein